MYRVESEEEVQWLGGEAHVQPYMGGPKPASLKGLVSGGMLLLAGMGIGRLMAVGGLKPEHGPQRGQRGQMGDVGARMPNERSGIMGQRQAEERYAEDRGVDGVGVVTILAAFGIGLVAGAVTTLLTTPESGTSVRNRLQRGIDTARKEFDEVVGEAKKDWTTVGDEISDSVKRTASRVKQAAEVTKDALTTNDASDRRIP